MGPFTKIFVSFSLQRVKNVDFTALLEGAMQKKKRERKQIKGLPNGFSFTPKKFRIKAN